VATVIETSNSPSRLSSLPTSSAGLLISQWNADLRWYFAVDFSLWDGAAGRRLRRGRGQPPGDEFLHSCLVQAVARKTGPQLIGILPTVLYHHE
jgi:hypothetical protein